MKMYNEIYEKKLWNFESKKLKGGGGGNLFQIQNGSEIG